MIYIGLLEDHQEDKERLIQMVNSFFRKHKEEYSLDSFDSVEEFKEKSKIKYDIYFLDIEMAEISGFDLAKEIRSLDEKAILIFTTNLVTYIQKAYEVSPLTYLLKPIKEKELDHAMEDASRIWNINHKKEFLIKTQEGLIPLNYDDILYIESEGHDIIYHSVQKCYHEWSSLTKVEKRLENHGFSRIKTSTMVNLKYITKVYFDKVELDKITLSIGRRYKEQFLRDMNLWMNR